MISQLVNTSTIMTTKEKIKIKLDEICKPYCNSEWCILKEMLLYTHDNLRTAEQLKLIEIFRWNLSQRQHREVNWEEASMKWVDSGMATKFAEYYNDDISVNALYAKIEEACSPFDN